MTNETNAMPDVIYTRWNKALCEPWIVHDGHGIKYIRSDLVPAAPTGDKDAALDRLDEMEKLMSDFMDLSHKNGVTALAKFKLKESCETIAPHYSSRTTAIW